MGHRCLSWTILVGWMNIWIRGEEERWEASFCVIWGNCYHKTSWQKWRAWLEFWETEVTSGPVRSDLSWGSSGHAHGGEACWGGGKDDSIAEQVNVEDGLQRIFFFNFTQLNRSMIYPSKSTPLGIFLPYHFIAIYKTFEDRDPALFIFVSLLSWVDCYWVLI